VSVWSGAFCHQARIGLGFWIYQDGQWQEKGKPRGWGRRRA
jgi:hypothetical protein